jgi:hypothetical protein
MAHVGNMSQVFASLLPFRIFLLRIRSTAHRDKVENGTSQGKSETSVNLSDRSDHHLLFELRLFTDKGADMFQIERYGLADNIPPPREIISLIMKEMARVGNMS